MTLTGRLGRGRLTTTYRSTFLGRTRGPCRDDDSHETFGLKPRTIGLMLSCQLLNIHIAYSTHISRLSELNYDPQLTLQMIEQLCRLQTLSYHYLTIPAHIVVQFNLHVIASTLISCPLLQEPVYRQKSAAAVSVPLCYTVPTYSSVMV